MHSQPTGFDAIVPKGTALERLATGFQFTEGPLWNALRGSLLFSDIRTSRIYEWSPTKGVTVFRELNGNSNGLTYDKEGRLIVCEHGPSVSNRGISRIEQDGTYTVLANTFRGKRLNSPNDVVVTSTGMIYFTDPPYGIKPEEQELSFRGVYCLSPHGGELTLLVDDFDRPNGLAFSPDETILYIADTSKRHVRAFDVQSDGMLSNSRVFTEIRSGGETGNPDGMKVDLEGNLYVAATGGIWVFNADGEHLGIIRTPEGPTNCGWGDDDWKTLHITARTSVYRVRLHVPGVKVP
jgi:gluconolactonase